MRALFLALVLALLVVPAAARAQGAVDGRTVPVFTATPTADGDMCPSSICEPSGASTVQYLGFHRGSPGTVQTWGPITLKLFHGVQSCRVEFLNAMPALCTTPNITIEVGPSRLTTDWNTLATFTGGTPMTTLSYDHRAPFGPAVRASLAADITDTDCDSGGTGALDLVVVCLY